MKWGFARFTAAPCHAFLYTSGRGSHDLKETAQPVHPQQQQQSWVGLGLHGIFWHTVHQAPLLTVILDSSSINPTTLLTTSEPSTCAKKQWFSVMNLPTARGSGFQFCPSGLYWGDVSRSEEQWQTWQSFTTLLLMFDISFIFSIFSIFRKLSVGTELILLF